MVPIGMLPVMAILNNIPVQDEEKNQVNGNQYAPQQFLEGGQKFFSLSRRGIQESMRFHPTMKTEKYSATNQTAGRTGVMRK
jgi:hypothetical protein